MSINEFHFPRFSEESRPSANKKKFASKMRSIVSAVKTAQRLEVCPQVLKLVFMLIDCNDHEHDDDHDDDEIRKEEQLDWMQGLSGKPKTFKIFSIKNQYIEPRLLWKP